MGQRERERERERGGVRVLERERGGVGVREGKRRGALATELLGGERLAVGLLRRVCCVCLVV